MTKINFFGVVFTVSMVLLTGCGGGATPSAPAAPTTPSSPTKSEVPAQVRLGYFANLTHAQALLGVARGDFQKALGDIPLKTSVFNAGPSAIEAIFAGEIDLTYIGPGPTINAHVKSHGQAVRVVAGSASNGVVIVTRKDSGIKTLDDLKGKRIATPQYGNTQDIAARAFVIHRLKDKPKNEGGTTTIDAIANAEQIGLFKQGLLDAAWAPEPWGSRLIHEAGATLLEEEKNLWDDKKFTITVVLVSKKFLDKYPAQVEALLKAHVELTEFLNKSPDQAAELINAELKRLTGKPIALDVLKESLSRTTFTTDPIQASFDKNAEWSFELGFNKEKADLTGLIDLSILGKLTK